MSEIVIKKVDEIRFIKEFYPRKELNDARVQEFTEIIEALPPIKINQDGIILDGAHRWHAYKRLKLLEIKVEIITTIDDDDAFLIAARLQDKGQPLARAEKRQNIIRLYKKLLDDKTGKLSYTVDRLKTEYSIPASTFSDWTKDINQQMEEQLLEKILDLYLQCKEVDEIVQITGLKKTAVYGKIQEIEEFVKIFPQNTESKFTEKYPNLSQKLNIFRQFQPQLYNIWNFARNNNETKHFGNVPTEITENLLYAYTEPFDVIFDPFGGGGATIDACKKWNRRYFVSDIQPVEISIQKGMRTHDITTGLPEGLPRPKLVFLDPPYWRQAKGQYTDKATDLSNMELPAFYQQFEDLFKLLKAKIVDGGYVAFIIQNTQWLNDNKKTEPHSHKIWNCAEKAGFIFETLIHVPYSSEQYNAQQVNYAKENKTFLGINRELVVLKK